MRTALLTILVLLFSLPAFAATAAQENSAVVLVYHHIGEDGFSDASLSLENFSEHLRFFKSDRYTVLPLAHILSNLENGGSLPENTLALTFEGAYKSTYDNALLSLIENKIPFTVFFAPDRIDRHAANYMSWNELRRLKAYSFVSFGLLPSKYFYLPSLSDKELRKSINHALNRSEQELGLRPDFFAIPYGAYSLTNLKTLTAYNFKAIFGQQSGVVHKGILGRVLPRFSMVEEYGSPDRFELIARAKPLYLENLTPEEHYLPEALFPAIGFNLDLKRHAADVEPACFASGIGRLSLNQIGGSRYEIRVNRHLPPGRLRVNCTLPYTGEKPGEMPRARWYGMVFSVPEPVIHETGISFPE